MLRPTFRALFPQEEHALGFQYFHHALDFEFGATVHSWVNAWWCAQLALLAYTDDEATWRAVLQKRQLQGKVLTEGGAHCLVAHDGKGNAWVAFRGTRIVAPRDFADLARWLTQLEASATDWLDNLHALPVPWPAATPGSCVHGGFLAGIAQLEPKLAAELAAVAGRSLWLTGHSLGGARALLSARFDCCGSARAIYSFGMPRAGNGAFAQSVGIPHFRHVNERDAVPEVPPEGGLAGYVHHGTLVEMPVGLLADPLRRVGIADDVLVPLPSADTVPAGFSHHAPLLYVAQCLGQLAP